MSKNKSIVDDVLVKLRAAISGSSGTDDKGALRIIRNAFRRVRSDERRKIFGMNKSQPKVIVPFAGGRYKCKLIVPKRKRKKK